MIPVGWGHPILLLLAAGFLVLSAIVACGWRPYPAQWSAQAKSMAHRDRNTCSRREPSCKCPSGSYNPGAVHEPYCPMAEDGAV